MSRRQNAFATLRFLAIERARFDDSCLLDLPVKTIFARRRKALRRAHHVGQGTGMYAHPGVSLIAESARAPSFGSAVIGVAIASVPDGWRCANTFPSLFTNAVYPDLPIESAISAQGLPSASSSSKANSTGVFASRPFGFLHSIVKPTGSRKRSSPRTILHYEGVNFAPRLNRPSRYGQSAA